jgi:peptide subunit release factor RF-3
VAYTEVNRQREEKTIHPEDEGFAGVVFKVQANMDANHRDRIAFVRVASGKYTPGMKMKVQRTGKELRPTSVVTFMSQRREAVDEAYAGDIIGFTTHGGVQLGDTITQGLPEQKDIQYTGLPFFAPELFQTVELADPLKSKQLQQGLQQLGEEGEKEGNHKEGEEKDHKEDKTAKNFEKVEVLKGVSDMGYTAVTFVNEIPANAKIVVKGAFFVNAKLSNAGGHEH